MRHVDPRERIVAEQAERLARGGGLHGPAKPQGGHRAAMAARVDQPGWGVWRGHGEPAKPRGPGPPSPPKRRHALPSPSPELTVVVPTYNERGNVEALVHRLHVALAGIDWAVLFVDDDSPDGTSEAVEAVAASDPRVACLKRVGRRGLSGAVIEGVLAARSPFVAVMDGDLQHDESRLPDMLAALRSGAADLAVGTRFAEGGRPEHGLSTPRRLMSAVANAGARLAIRTDVSDPMSGYFMIDRDRFERAVPMLSRSGFKILFDLIASHPERLRIQEFPYAFGERLSGESKMDGGVAIDYAALLARRVARRLTSTRAAVVAGAGAAGAVVGASLGRILRRR